MRHGMALLAAAAALAGGACGHSEGFTTPDTALDSARTAGLPAQLTYNVADDRTASWLPDGSGIVYSTELLGRHDNDRCLAALPPGGGTIRRTLCELRATHGDSTDRFESPAVNEAGDLAAVRIVSRIGAQKGTGTSSGGEIVVAPGGDLGSAAILHSLYYGSPTGQLHTMAGHLRWLSPARLVWVGQRLFFEGSTFYPDTFVTGLEVMRADLATPGAVAGAATTPVPNTLWASSVAPGPTADEIYLTVAGEPRVYRLSLATGERTVVYEEPGGEILRDVDVRGDRLVAIVGRSVLARVEAAQHDVLVQRDEGGDLLLVDLASGTVRRIALADWLFRRPRIAPDGESVVVERSPFAEVQAVPRSDYNAPNHRPDLWLFSFR